MKTLRIVTALGMAAILFTACKKDTDPASDGGISFDDGGNVNVGADASGAMYAIVSRTFDGNTGTSYEEDHVATAWFGSATSPVNAGVVRANDEELQAIGGGTFSWYFSMNFDPIFNNGNNVTWSVAGNLSSGVAAFSHTDDNAFPTGLTYTLPAAINVSSGFTLNHTSSGSADAVLYKMLGFDGGQVTKYVVGPSTGISFSAAEVQSVAAAGGEPIGFMVVPVSIRSASYNGKKYYFVKQYQNLRETVTL